MGLEVKIRFLELITGKEDWILSYAILALNSGKLHC